MSSNMYKEIFEQDKVFKRLIRKYIRNGRVDFGFTENVEFKLKNITRFTFLGCGSSYYADLLGNYYIEELAELPCEFEFADEFNFRKTVIEKNTGVVLISQSGETRDIIMAGKKAKKNKAFVVGITNNPNSSLGKMADVVIDTCAGEEKAIAATKTFTSQLLVLLMMSLYVGRLKNENKKRLETIREIKELSEKIKKIFALESEIKKMSKKYYKENDIIFLGRKFQFPIAMEGAHKTKETTYIHAEGYASEEFIHGPNAIIDRKFLSIFLMPRDEMFRYNINVLKKIKQAGSKIVIFTTEKNTELNKYSKDVIILPKANERVMPILSVISLQMLAYFIAINKKIDVDKPRNLEKFIK